MKLATLIVLYTGAFISQQVPRPMGMDDTCQICHLSPKSVYKLVNKRKR